jgi:hypothetical protein
MPTGHAVPLGDRVPENIFILYSKHRDAPRAGDRP